MKRTTVILAVILVFGLPVVLAASPHFIRSSASISNSGDLTVAWKEAGLGNNQNIDYVTSADATIDYACINGGKKHPRAANKETVSGPVSAAGTFNSGRNGQITASLTVEAPGPGDFSCPPGQRLMIARATYSNISLLDVTNGVGSGVGGTLCRQFVALDEFAC